VPCDQHGCKHSGLLDLKSLPKNYIAKYIKPGEWLDGKPCKDCADETRQEGRGDDTTRVMDLSTLLTVKSEIVAFYCNSGPNGHRMEPDEEDRNLWLCDMVLCMNCYTRRQQSSEEKIGRTSRRKRKSRFERK
jgi:hypothetical protein